MNGKMAKRIRSVSVSHAAYRKLKRAYTADRAAQAQCSKPLVIRSRRRSYISRPTWPATLDQCGQSRPLIILRPVRQILSWYRSGKDKLCINTRLAGLPKCVLDARVLHGY